MDTSIETVTVFSVETNEVTESIREIASEYFPEVHMSSITSGSIDGDLCVSVGGDGTYLEAVYRCTNRESVTPVLGVHTGSLGFLSRVPVTDVEDAFETLRSGGGEIIQRGRVSANVSETDFNASGLNDVMVTPEPPEKAVDRKICTLHTYISDTYIGAFSGSGLAVSTPTGSTAVSLSAGGPIHYPNDNFALQVTPLQTHNIGVRPIIFDKDECIRVYSESDVNLMVDGGRSMTTLKAGDELKINGSTSPAKLVRTTFDDSFFDALCGKLGWGLRDVDETGPYPIDGRTERK